MCDPATDREAAQVGRRIDKTFDPFVMLDAELLDEIQVCAIDNGLV
jgi:hypothetical protein